MKFILRLIIAIFTTILLQNCSTFHKSNSYLLFDDTIPKAKPKAPEATFYKGNFFQYFPAPVKNNQKID